MDFIHLFRSFLKEQIEYDENSIISMMKEFNICFQYLTSVVPSPQPPLEYGRYRIAKTEILEAILTNYPPHVETPIHDHGRSIGFTYVVQGCLLNRFYQFQADSKLIIDHVEEVHTGEFIFHKKGMIHATYNPVEENLITLNVYAPPQQDTKIYSI
ncbi:Cysteine dioxygenase type I [Seinonella peptonophila]|uniref:Cysteine dioxygenase type I n=1 Tax=Seinonella peptonophila TaxID=112248 RepID=A0A1M4W9B8_9BACL|nr:cysteine dioxygenase family protein [Seinonella peptonophila]SHE77750.1 Cysteine dioxygenase type I [Seinonella peptonophila]